MSEQNKQDENQAIVDSSNGAGNEGSSLNMNENVAGLLCYVATFITGIIFLLIEKKSKFVKFHAMQSLIFFGAIWILNFIVDFIPYIGWLFSMLLTLLGFIMWIVLMVKAYQKEYFKLPVIGDIADDLVNKKPQES